MKDRHTVQFTMVDSYDTTWSVTMIEFDDLSVSVDASFPDSAVPYTHEFEELEFDAAPTLAELRERLEWEAEKRNDAAWESYVSNHYSC